jgi:hypothetical protein
LRRNLVDQHWQGRANCYGREGVFADFIALALGQNAITAYHHRLSTGTSPPTERAA